MGPEQSGRMGSPVYGLQYYAIYVFLTKIRFDFTLHVHRKTGDDPHFSTLPAFIFRMIPEIPLGPWTGEGFST
jgi:hypothetical protein